MANRYFYNSFLRIFETCPVLHATSCAVSTWGFSTVMQCPLTQVDQSFPSVAKDNNAWFCISAHPYTFMARCLINPLNAELNPIHHLLALLGGHHILHVRRLRVKVELDCKGMKRMLFEELSYPIIYLEGLRKKHKFSVSVWTGDRDLKTGSPEYNRRVTTRQSVTQCSLVRK